MTKRLALAVLLPVAAVTGCGGGSDGGGPVATTEVAMAKSYRFDPAAIEVGAGSTVTWRNDDNFTHTVQVEGGDDHKVAPGESVSLRFEEPGTFAYVCTLHRTEMDGEVVVR